jgi:hypothetical protein
MARCSHGHTAPSSVLANLPICQAGTGRHKCAVCAYAEGLKSAVGKRFAGPAEECDQRHGVAPRDMLIALPESQAGIERHKCAYQAFEEGKKAGLALGDEATSEAEAADEQEVERVLARSDIDKTEKEQLVKARLGQGAFRANVALLASTCRMTGIGDARFLIASHIKPWRDSSDKERLDGYNGLFLAPHADLLFDRGWVTFESDGNVAKSPHLPQGVWEAWKFEAKLPRVPFDARYHPYLRHHNEKVFRA